MFCVQRFLWFFCFCSLKIALAQTTHECNRPCVKGATPKTCRYKFSIQWYTTMSKSCFDCPVNIEDCYRQDCAPGMYKNLSKLDSMHRDRDQKTRRDNKKKKKINKIAKTELLCWSRVGFFNTSISLNFRHCKVICNKNICRFVTITSIIQ